MRVLILGATGQLGQELMRGKWPPSTDICTLKRSDVDFTQLGVVSESVKRVEPDIVINAAAYTAVDNAESDQWTAHIVNAEAPRVLAVTCKSIGAPLIHFSTDYVFDGSKLGTYDENDNTAPLGVYGRTKAAGEVAIRENFECHLILRTAWIYSEFGHNFVKTMVRLVRERDEVRVVDDQVGCPTEAADLARGVIAAVPRLLGARPPFGTYHLAGRGETSWYGFAGAIFEGLHRRGISRARLIPITTDAYPTLARRPANSRLNSALFEQTFAFRLKDWPSALDGVLTSLCGERRQDR